MPNPHELTAQTKRHEVYKMTWRAGPPGFRRYVSAYEVIAILSREPRRYQPVKLPETIRSNRRKVLAFVESLERDDGSTARDPAPIFRPGERVHVVSRGEYGDRHHGVVAKAKPRMMLDAGVGRWSGSHLEPHVLVIFEEGGRSWENVRDLHRSEPRDVRAKRTSRDRRRDRPSKLAYNNPDLASAASSYFGSKSFRDMTDAELRRYAQRAWDLNEGPELRGARAEARRRGIQVA